MRRLYLRIYLAVIASVLLSVVLAGVAWYVIADPRSYAPRREFFQAMAQTMLPPASASPEQQRQAVEHLNRLSGFDLALLNRDGHLIAATGDIWDESRARVRSRGPFGRHAIGLEDGRSLYAQPQGGPRAARGFGWLATLLGIAAVVAFCAWPVVRRLTRDLERLESGVAAFGEGDLSARANIRGRDEVARLAATFNAAAERVETLVRANKALLANASHELRSPLARLRMSIENVGTDTSAPVREEIARNVRELDSLVDEILTSSRLDARAAASLRKEELDLRALAAEECARAGVEFSALEGSGQPVQGDARLLQRLMRNLVENALRYGSAPVDVLLYRATDGMRFEVSDRGAGVPVAERERIFEPFYRPQGASERAGGVGLGLALVYQIARAHGGDAHCLPRDGGGACFRATLPVQPM